MARPKQKDRPRYPCGKLRPEMAPTTIRRMVDRAQRRAEDPLLGTELGRLYLAGVIDDLQLRAGSLYAELVGAHDRASGMPPRTVRSPSWQEGFDRGRAAPEGEASEARAEREREAVYDMAVANSVLEAASSHARRIVGIAAVLNEIVLFAERPHLVVGLQALAVHFFGLRQMDVA